MIVVNARSAAVNENKIRQQYKNRLNNAQGQHFEREILAGCKRHSRLGALCGVCICIQDDFFFIPWNVWRDMKEMYGRQYLKPDDIEEYKVKFDGAVHFLMHTEELKGAYENAERKR